MKDEKPIGIRCPRCKCKIGTQDGPRPLPGGAERRYRICVQCGYKVVTKERIEKVLSEGKEQLG